MVWGGEGGHEMFIRWYCVVLLKPNIGSHILKQSHEVSLSSVHSVFPNMLPARKSHLFKPISYINLNTNLWQNFGIWELPSNAFLMLQIISCLNSKDLRKEFCTAALCLGLALLLEKTLFVFFLLQWQLPIQQNKFVKGLNFVLSYGTYSLDPAGIVNQHKSFSFTYTLQH